MKNEGQWGSHVDYATLPGPFRVGSSRAQILVAMRGLSSGTGAGHQVIGLSFSSRPEPTRVELVDPINTQIRFLCGADRSRAVASAGRALRLNGSCYSMVVRATETPNRVEFGLTTLEDTPSGVESLRISGVSEALQKAPGQLDLRTTFGPLKLRVTGAVVTNIRLGAASSMDSPGDGFADLDLVASRQERSAGDTITVILEWSTFLGGTGTDLPNTVLYREDDVVLVVGATDSAGFPTTRKSYDDSLNAPEDGFVMAVDSQTGDVLWSTFIGGAWGVTPTDASLTRTGDVLLTGATISVVFEPTPGAYAVDLPGGGAVVGIMRLSSDGSSMEFAGFIGGNVGQSSTGIAEATDGSIIVVGGTTSSVFPLTPDAVQATHAGGFDGFMARFDSDGSMLLYSTFLGGIGLDGFTAVGVLEGGDIVVAGRMSDPRLATSRAFQTELASVFLARFSADLTTKKAATFFGGSCMDTALDMAIGPDGRVVIAGWTCSVDLPTTPDAFAPVNPGGGLSTPGFVSALDATLSDLVFSTFVGSGMGLEIQGLSLDASGVVTLNGRTDSTGFPVTLGAFDPTYNGPVSGDMVVARLSPDGRKLYYGSYLGGTDDDAFGAHPVSVDPSGDAYFAGATISHDFPVTLGAFQAEPQGMADIVLVKMSMLPEGTARYGASTPGCLGPLAIGVTAQPRLGAEDFGFTCSAAPVGSASGLLALGLSPLERPMAAVGVDVLVDPGSLVALIPVRSDALGFNETLLRVPADAAFAGLQAFAQYVWPDPCGPAGWSASNALALTVQP